VILVLLVLLDLLALKVILVLLDLLALKAIQGILAPKVILVLKETPVT
jgi:hypothetical protein